MAASSSDPKDKSMFGEMVFLAVLVSFFIYLLYLKLLPRFMAFWVVHGWQVEAISILLALVAVLGVAISLWNRYVDYDSERAITRKDKLAVHLGVDDLGRDVALKQQFRRSHAQIIGTTNAGKTESAVLPWAIHDIETGSGLLIIDGKSDHSFLNKLYAYVHRSGRESDFRLFSLANTGPSSTFNPLAGGESAEVAERVFSSFEFENEHYKNIQYKVFLSMIRLIHSHGRVPTFALIQRLLTDMITLKVWNEGCPDDALKREIELFIKTPDKERSENISGLDASISHFCVGKVSELFNSESPQIDLSQALEKGQICYFQLPTMYAPFLGRATGKLVLQALQGAIARRHLGLTENKKFFSVFLDDFQDYIYPGFGALLNKSRSADIGVVFSHQSLGDLSKVSPDFKDVVLTCTNVKVVMKNNDPDARDYFSRSFGTFSTEKTTERQTKTFFGKTKTGEESVRGVEEFKIHPNLISELPTGHGIVAIPHPKGTKIIKVKFAMRKNLPVISLPQVKKPPFILSQAMIPPFSQDETHHRAK